MTDIDAVTAAAAAAKKKKKMRKIWLGMRLVGDCIEKNDFLSDSIFSVKQGYELGFGTK